MKFWIGIATLLGFFGCAGCTPTSPPSAGLPPERVYNTLVEAGCLAATDSGLSSVIAEHADHKTAWMECLFEAGTIASCGVPCK